MRRSLRRTPAIWPGVFMAVLLGAGIAGTQYSAQLSRLADLASTSLTSAATSGSTYELNRVAEDDGTEAVARWNPCQDAITYKINMARIPAAKRAATVVEIKTGFKRLAAADGMTYRYKGATSFVPAKDNLEQQPAEIVVAAAEPGDTTLAFGDSALGFGGIVWTTWTGTDGDGAAIVRGYVVLSPTGLDTLRPGFGKGMTQGNLILHELGHATGMEHADRSDELMHATLSKTSADGFNTGDLQGLKKLGASSGCVDIPSGAGLKDLN